MTKQDLRDSDLKGNARLLQKDSARHFIVEFLVSCNKASNINTTKLLNTQHFKKIIFSSPPPPIANIQVFLTFRHRLKLSVNIIHHCVILTFSDIFLQPPVQHLVDILLHMADIILNIIARRFHSDKRQAIGTVVRFYCNPPYQINGFARATCTAAGTWSHDPPTCARGKAFVFLLFSSIWKV